MATRQIAVSLCANGVNNQTQYTVPLSASWDTANIPCRVPFQLKLKQIAIVLSAPPGTGNSYTYDLLKNGSTTGLQIVISDAATTGEMNGNVSYGVDDTFVLRRTPASAPDLGTSTITWVYDMTQSNKNAYLQHLANNASTTLRGSAYGFRTATTGVGFNPSPIAGNITKAKYDLSVAPGASKSFSIALYKNNVIQDGAGGTPDTRVSIADSAVSGEWAGTLVVAEGDIIEILPAPTNTPATSTIAASIGFEQTTDGESVFGIGGSQSSLPTSANTYFGKQYRNDSTAFGTTESAVEITIGGTGLAFTVTKFYWAGVLSVSNSPVLSIRRSQGDPTLPPSITMSSTSGNDTGHSAAFVSGDEIGLKLVLSASPGAARSCWTGLAMFAQAQAGKGAGTGKRGGSNVLVPSGATTYNVGNAGLDIGNLN